MHLSLLSNIPLAKNCIQFYMHHITPTKNSTYIQLFSIKLSKISSFLLPYFLLLVIVSNIVNSYRMVQWYADKILICLCKICFHVHIVTSAFRFTNYASTYQLTLFFIDKQRQYKKSIYSNHNTLPTMGKECIGHYDRSAFFKWNLLLQLNS